VRRGVVALLTLVILGLAWGTGAAQPAPTQSLARARAEFERGEYQRVIETLSPQLYPHALLREEDDLEEAHYLLGVAYYYLARRDLARQEFTALLFLDPSRSLDPATESPEVYGFFEGVKSELRGKLEEIRKQKERDEEARRLPQRERVIERTVHEISPWSNFVPFGYGQFRNGQAAKGVFFLVTQTLLGGTSVSLFSWQAVNYGIPSYYPPGTDLDQLRRFQTIQVVTGGLFLVTYIWQVIDAFSNQPERITTTETERPITPAAAPSSLLLSPVVSPGQVGLGATWRF
jgi:tetratricopeptide (TPR) repeat protein